MQAIILAGGFGTRLRAVVAHLPKPMAPIHDKPFLAHLLAYLRAQGVDKVILSVHYLREHIEDYFKTYYQGTSIQYAVEAEPLGTGGAIINALPLLDNPNEPVFILNGDTFLKLNYRAMLAQHQKTLPWMTMALCKMADCTRYGQVVVADGQLLSFHNQGSAGPGLINAGIYLLTPQQCATLPFPSAPFSFEKDFLFPYVAQLKPRAFIVEDYFIDIGIPEDYTRAKEAFLPG